MKAIKKLRSATPEKWKRIGTNGLVLCTSLSMLIPSAPMSEHAQKFTMFWLGVAGLLFKFITNFATEEASTPPETPAGV